MKKIELTQGQVALVDDEDFEYLNQWKWFARWDRGTKSFYAGRSNYTDKKHVAMHRVIMGLDFGDKVEIDHINHNTLDNTKANLRLTNHIGNAQNRRCRGYCFHKQAQKYQAQIKINGKVIFLGLYITKDAARKAYLAAKEIYHPLRVIA